MEVIKIDDLNTEELSIFGETSEIQLYRYYEPEPGIFIAESPNVVMRAIEAGHVPFRNLH